MAEQTLIDHMLTELARREEEHRRLADEASRARAVELRAQEAQKEATKAMREAGAEVKQMQAALSALGYEPGQGNGPTLNEPLPEGTP